MSGRGATMGGQRPMLVDVSETENAYVMQARRAQRDEHIARALRACACAACMRCAPFGAE